jgi:hypothetical protein
MLITPETNGALQILAAAVTPVVMVSATAILISGVNSRYMAISDRMRSITHEYRDKDTSPERRSVLRRQLSIFTRRVELVSWAVRTLYLAAACFVSVALLISATSWRHMLVEVTLPLFFMGIVLIMIAICCQLLELHASNRTILLEVKDVLEEKG